MQQRLGDCEYPDRDRHLSEPTSLIGHRLFRQGSVKLFIGAGSSEYIVNKSVLSQIPFFAKAFDSGFKESYTNEITLEDLEPDVFDLVLYWAYKGCFPAYKWETEEEHGASLHKFDGVAQTELQLALLGVYIAGEMWCSKELKNAVMRCLYGSCKQSCEFLPSRVLIKTAQNLPQSAKMWKFAVHDLAYGIRSHRSDLEVVLAEVASVGTKGVCIFLSDVAKCRNMDTTDGLDTHSNIKDVNDLPLACFLEVE